MGFRINTNIDALSAHASATANNRALSSSLGRLNSGLRIQSAADDASGLAIADSLRSQASSLTQAISNGNDAIGIIQTADKAMDEQLKILDTIKAKSVQAAQDGQTSETRKALQADISRLMEELDMIGNTTSFNGQKLLSGSFTNKEFQVGAYSNETVKASIGPTTSDKIGLTRFETGRNVVEASLAKVGAANLRSGQKITFMNVDGVNDITLEPLKLAEFGNNFNGTITNLTADNINTEIKIKAGMGLGGVAEAMNRVSDKTGIKATATVETVFSQISAGDTLDSFSINGVKIGKVSVQANDANGALRAAINAVKDKTGVEASVDSQGRLVLNNRDGRGIMVMGDPATAGSTGLGTVATGGDRLNFGRLSLVRLGGNDIQVKVGDSDLDTAMKAENFMIGFNSAEKAPASATPVTASKYKIDEMQNAETIGTQKKMTGQTSSQGNNTVLIDGLYYTAAGVKDGDGNVWDSKNVELHDINGKQVAYSKGGHYEGGKVWKSKPNFVLNGTAYNADAVEIAGQAYSKGVQAITVDVTAQKTVSLREMNGGKINADLASAMGFNSGTSWGSAGSDQGAGVTTLKGAMAMMNIAETAQKALDSVRSDLGSVQKQLEATVNNITVTQVNVKSAESNIRDVDFAAESATFSKHNILAQSGTYAMSQANATAQNVMRLLQ